MYYVFSGGSQLEVVFAGELGSMEKSKRRVGVRNTGCPHCIFCARGVVAVRIGTDLALHGRALFEQFLISRTIAGERLTG